MVRKKKSGGGGANWMDTYGDMVTLLLCFFVLLYSMSTISEEKWKAIVMSFNPDSIPDQTEIVGGNPTDFSSDGAPDNDVEDIDLAEIALRQAEIQQAMDELYEKLKEYAEESGVSESVTITEGDGYVFISFRDTVFFDGDKTDIRPDGQVVLQQVAEILSAAVDYIDEVRVMGHTAQASADKPNNPINDRRISAVRASNAAAYIQMNSTLDPARIVSVGYGQHRPISSNDTEENRKLNRRVEICVTGFDLMDELGDSIEQYNTMVGIESGSASADD